MNRVVGERLLQPIYERVVWAPRTTFPAPAGPVRQGLGPQTGWELPTTEGCYRRTIRVVRNLGGTRT